MTNQNGIQELSFRAACKAKHENAIALPAPILAGALALESFYLAKKQKTIQARVLHLRRTKSTWDKNTPITVFFQNKKNHTFNKLGSTSKLAYKTSEKWIINQLIFVQY